MTGRSPQELVLHWNKLKAERSQFERTWQEIADYDGDMLSGLLKDALGIEVRDLLYRPEEDAVTEWREPYRATVP